MQAAIRKDRGETYVAALLREAMRWRWRRQWIARPCRVHEPGERRAGGGPRRRSRNSSPGSFADCERRQAGGEDGFRPIPLAECAAVEQGTAKVHRPDATPEDTPNTLRSTFKRDGRWLLDRVTEEDVAITSHRTSTTT